MKKPTSKDKKQLVELMENLDFLFGINAKSRSMVYMKEDRVEDTLERQPALDVAIEEDYNRVRIRIYPCFWEHTKDEQRKMVVHEYCHVLVSPLHQIAQNLLDGKLETTEHKRVAWEKSVTSIDYIINNFLSGEYQWAKKSYQKYK